MSETSSFDSALLKQTTAIEMRQFDDAQFLNEPRLSMMQKAFHSMRQTTYAWAQQGILGETQKQESDQQVRPAIMASFASATMQRPTLNQYQMDRITYARNIIEQLVKTVKTLGQPGGGDETPESAYEFCDLGGSTLGVRGHIDSRGAWIYSTFEPMQDVHHAISRISTIQTLHRKMATPATLRILPLHSRQAQDRAIEIMELARWALRQPVYSPAK